MPWVDVKEIRARLTIAKEWEHGKDEKIWVGTEEEQLHAYIIRRGFALEIPFYNISGIPQGFDLKNLTAFLGNTWMKVGLSGDAFYLNIHLRLSGGGNIIRDPAKLWPGGVVPYEIDLAKYPIGTEARAHILTAIFEWNQAETGIRFFPRIDEVDCVIFGGSQNVYCPEVGRRGGAQYIYLQEEEALNKAIIMHKLGHAVGLLDEHTRFDRDKYLFLESNDHPHYTKNHMDNVHGEYDVDSIMHYSVNRPLKDGQGIYLKFYPDLDELDHIGFNETLSQGDREAAHTLYLSSLENDEKCEPGRLPLIQLNMQFTSNQVITPTPQWQIIKSKGEYCFSQQNYSGAFFYYFALLQEYREQLPFPLWLQLHIRCGVCQYELEDDENAEKWLGWVLKILPDNQKVKNYYELTRQRLLKKYLMEADRLFERRHEQNIIEYDVYYQALLKYCMLIQDYASTLGEFAPHIYHRAGKCFYKLSMFEEAAGFFLEACKLVPNEPVYQLDYELAINQKK